MIEAVAVGGVALALLVTSYWWQKRRQPYRALEQTLEERLTEAFPAGAGTHLEQSPRVRRIDVDSSTEHGITPVVRIDLETTDAPGMEIVFDYVADVLEAIHPELGDEAVTRYDLEFTFGPDGLLVDGQCRRVTVPAAFADRLLEEETYRAFDLRRDVERGDDGSATLWGEC